jgi:Zn-dependent M16 (insulinase) family peptidase
LKLTKGTLTQSGFEIIDIVELAELDAKGVWARHIKSGAEVFHLVNDDTENTFAFAFKTLPQDSSGVFHIIEHSVLCGSKKYPLKDPFINLAQGSLQTYLNAWTFADKTVYPASSLSEKDYFNLMSVYGDAVYHPNLAEWTFLQEGRRFELPKENAEDGAENDGAKNRLTINGIVYNEMKGAYSALDEYAHQWSDKSVLPDTLYALDSGGDPLCIPNLTYTEFIDTYKKYYCPANTLIFLYGNIDTEKQLGFLNANFFEGRDAGQKAPAITPPVRWNEPRKYIVPSPAGGAAADAGAPADGGSENNSVNKLTVFISWLCNDFNFEENPDCAYKALALDVLCDILLGHDGSPLAKALVSSGLGEDLAGVCGYNDEIKFHVFTAGLRGVGKPFDKAPEKRAARIEKFIFSELKKLVKKGIPRREIEAALFSEEFSEREIKRPHQGPWALVLLRRSLRGWLHGAVPWETLLVQENFKRLKKEVEENPRFFEQLIQRELLDNKHRALVTIKPTPEFSREREAAEQKFLREKEASLDDAQKTEIHTKCAELERIQNEDDTALPNIPHLSLDALETQTNNVPRRLLDAGGIPVVSHKIWTNGVSYITLAFPLDAIAPDDYIYLSLFANCLTALGLPGRRWADVSSELACTVGDFYAYLHASSGQNYDGIARATPAGILPLGGRDWLLAHFKTTAEKLPAAFALVTRILREADFGDERRIVSLIEEARNSAYASMSAAGTLLAASRASRSLSHAAAAGEIWHGITQLEFISKLTRASVKPLAKKFRAIRDALSASPVLVNITGDNEDAAMELVRTVGSGQWVVDSVRSGSKQSTNADNFVSTEISDKNLPTTHYSPPTKTDISDKNLSTVHCSLSTAEVFSSPSLQTGFAALCIPSSDIRTAESVAEQVLSHYLSTGALWEKLRMKGGAYGAHCSVSNIAVCFSTYRDPSPALSVRSLAEIIGSAPVPRGGELEKTIIGVYAKIKEPHSPGKKGSIDFIRYLDGIDDTLRQRRFTQILQMTPEALESAALRIARNINIDGGSAPGICVIAGKKEAEAAAAAFGVDVCPLPV